MADIALNEDFSDLLVALHDAGADFVLLGGWAMALHGHGRGTDDIDILVRPSDANGRRVLKALINFGAPVMAHGVKSSLFATPNYGYRMGIRPNLIELLTFVHGIDFEEAYRDHRVFELEGRKIPYIGRSALVKNKLAAGRPKDLADVEWLRTNPEASR